MTQQNIEPQLQSRTIKLLGGQANYEWFKKVNELPSFNKSPLYHSMLPQERLANDIDNMVLLVKMCREGIVKPEMLKYIAINLFGPAFVLMAHYEYFRCIVMNHAPAKLREGWKEKIDSFEIIGGVLDDLLNLDLTTPTVPKLILRDGIYSIQQSDKSIFFSSTTNMLMDSAVVFVEYENRKIPILVQLKDLNRNLLPRVTTRYIGDTISTEHTLIGYNLNGCVVSQQHILNHSWGDKDVNRYRHHWDYCLFELSLLDLYKACDIVIRYTQMRKQFQTIPNSKQERPIGQYQAVMSRVTDALSLSYALASLYVKVQPAANKAMFAPYFQYTHHIILQKLLQLRECCGGFGYIRYSGLPQLLQRVIYRSSLNRKDAPFPTNQMLLSTFMYYVSSPDILMEFKNPNDIKTEFSYFGIVCICNRLNAQSQSQAKKQQYIFEFIRDCSIQLFYNQERRFTYVIPDNPITALIKYMSATIALENSQHITWEYVVKLQPKQLLDYLINSRNKQMASISKKMMEFSKVFNFGHFPDVILGRENQSEFYDVLLATSKANRRNEAEFLDYVKKPIADFLIENNAKL